MHRITGDSHRNVSGNRCRGNRPGGAGGWGCCKVEHEFVGKLPNHGETSGLKKILIFKQRIEMRHDGESRLPVFEQTPQLSFIDSFT